MTSAFVLGTSAVKFSSSLVMAVLNPAAPSPNREVMLENATASLMQERNSGDFAKSESLAARSPAVSDTALYSTPAVYEEQILIKILAL